VGGSHGAKPTALRRLMRALARQARCHFLVVVPGGGAFADVVRRADRRFALGESAAHWMAILAMDQYGYLLADLAPGSTIARRRSELVPGRLNILAPSAWLLRADPLPHSWDVTSDSIAAWFARKLGARRLMLVKHEDGFIGPDRGPGSMPPRVRQIVLEAFSGAVDPYFARALDPAIGCWLVRGHLPHRIERLIKTGGTRGVVDGGRSRRRQEPSRLRPPADRASAAPGTGRSHRPSSTP
jgi:5-(aminomethyl)-3-furanmethanol phosphate kinase